MRSRTAAKLFAISPGKPGFGSSLNDVKRDSVTEIDSKRFQHDRTLGITYGSLTKGMESAASYTGSTHVQVRSLVTEY